ncbi:hypothetical protein [Tautonia sociabilis]|uniref:hypothetical protein n=1 Tax=Tautonia sociabilis TaxID=2080755 RepID=UPI0018F39A11|nr:hypothetical protein [Tautonia sociabilis]
MYQEMSREILTVSPDHQHDGSRVRASEKARRASRASHASGRRRNVDPTTTDREYSSDEMEFIRAMQEYKRRSGRMFPTWSEVLEVLRSLGYEKPEPVDEAVAARAVDTRSRLG